MRMSFPLRETISAILLTIEDREEANAQEIAELMEEPQCSYVHKSLYRLEEGGWLKSRVEKISGERNRPRRYYRLTKLGGAALHFHRLVEEGCAGSKSVEAQPEGRPN